MRVMAYLGGAHGARRAVGRVAATAGRLESAEWFLRAAVVAPCSPFIMNTAGWMLTENGRQPWIVQGLMKTADGVSPSVSVDEIWISLAVFALLYVALGVADLVLMLRYARRDLPCRAAPSDATPSRPDLLTMSLETFWFILVAVFWTGFFVLEGFDFGVGVLHPSWARRGRAAARCSTRSARSGTATRSG